MYLAAIWSLDRTRPMADGAIYRTRRFRRLADARVWIWTQCFLGGTVGRSVEGEVVPLVAGGRRAETHTGQKVRSEQEARLLPSVDSLE